jgi:hypothetical protein
MALDEEVPLPFLDREAPYESEQGWLPQRGTRRPVGRYPIIAIGETHGRSLNPG